MSAKRGLDTDAESTNDGDKGREVKVKLEEPDDEDKGRSDAFLERKCVVCFREMPFGQESMVCRNQLSSSSSSSEAGAGAGSEVRLRGEHYHCLECYKAMPRKQCGLCKAPFFAPSADGKVVDLENFVPNPQVNANGVQPINPYSMVLHQAERRDIPTGDSRLLAILCWENNNCRLLRGHEPQFIATFLHRLIAANQHDLAIYILAREERNTMPNIHSQVRAVVVNNQPIPDALAVQILFARIIVDKLSLFIVQNRDPLILGRLYVMYKKYLVALFDGSVHPTLSFAPHAQCLCYFAGMLRRSPRVSGEVLGRWFCTATSLDTPDAIRQVFDDQKEVAPMLPLLNADCFTDRLTWTEGLFATTRISVETFQYLTDKFPWIVKVAWKEFRALLFGKNAYHPLASHLYANHYDQAPINCRYVPQIAVPTPPELDAWSAHYLFDPVAVKWFCAPHAHINNKDHYTEIYNPVISTVSRVTILPLPLPNDKAVVAEEPPVTRLHVFYFARANEDGTHHRRRGEASFWDIPDEKYLFDGHTSWRYWKLQVLAKLPDARRVPVVPGTTFRVEKCCTEHEISLVNTPTF